MRITYNCETAVIQVPTETQRKLLDYAKGHRDEPSLAYTLLMLAGMNWREADQFMLQTNGFRMEANEELDAGHS